ncbi:MAG: alpha/beta hydrolase [Dehalococcoidia bacterium]|nr:alpha/beta hydrolase [Dehalococcoidia bacterium]
MTTTTREITVNGMTFRCREAGESGEPVILLHGFPETSHMWTQLLPELVAADYRCLAPDQRGYSPKARPEGKENYQTDLLAKDVIDLADAWGVDKFHLIAHDWGAGVGWRVVMTYPERVQSWTALSIPHPASYGRAFRDDPDQQEKSQYIFFFQEPGVAEAAFAANDWEMLRNIWAASDDEEKREYVAQFTEPGAMTAALNWYRGSFGMREDPGNMADAERKVATPTLTIWGNGDQAVGRATTLAQTDYMTGYNKFVELDAGHWLIQERFDDVKGEILAHLRQFPLA